MRRQQCRFSPGSHLKAAGTRSALPPPPSAGWSHQGCIASALKMWLFPPRRVQTSMWMLNLAQYWSAGCDICSNWKKENSDLEFRPYLIVWGSLMFFCLFVFLKCTNAFWTWIQCYACGFILSERPYDVFCVFPRVIISLVKWNFSQTQELQHLKRYCNIVSLRPNLLISMGWCCFDGLQEQIVPSMGFFFFFNLQKVSIVLNWKSGCVVCLKCLNWNDSIWKKC